MTVLPLATGRKLLGVIPTAVEGFFRHHCTQHAAGIAYRILFSLAPLAIVLVSILGVVIRSAHLRDDVIDLVLRHLPFSESGAQNVRDAIVAIASPASALGFLSLFVFFWAASGMMGSIRTGLEAALEVDRGRPAARGKLIDLALVVVTSVLVLVVAGLSVLGELIRRGLEHVTSSGGGILDALIQRGIPFAVSAVVVFLLYRFVPARRVRVPDAIAGALVTAVFLLAISLASGFVYTRTARLSIVYGSLTAALVFLYSVFLYACAVLFGAEVASAWSKPEVVSTEPLWSQVKRAAASLFVHRSQTLD